MDPAPYKRVFTRILDGFEPIAYLTIAFALSVPIVMLVVSAAMTMLKVAHLGVLETVLALIAVVRRILLLTAGLEQAESMEKFQNMVIELGVMTSLVIVLTIALYFTHRMRLSDPTL